MKRTMSRNEAREQIQAFFEREEFSFEEVKKIKKLAMKYRIRLKEERKRFCKNCFSKLRGETKVSKDYKVIVCEKCGYKNKFKITPRS